MGIYTNINEEQSAPSIVPFGTANVIVFGFDDDNDDVFDSNAAAVSSAGLTNRVMRITQKADFTNCYDGTMEDTPLSKWVDSYFTEVSTYAVDDAQIWLYRMKTTDTGDTYSEQVAVQAGSLKDWRTAVGPVASITEVKVSYDGGTKVDQSGGYTAEQDDNDLYTGKITFKNNYPKNGDGDYEAIDLDTDTVYISYTTGSLSDAFSVVKEVDAQFCCLCHDNGRMTGATAAETIYNGTSALDDWHQLLAFAEQRSAMGRYTVALCSAPSNSKPGDDASDYGGSDKFQDLRPTDIGRNKRFCLASFKQDNALNSGTGYRGEFDNSAVLAGMIRKCAIGTPVMFTQNSTPMSAYDDESMQIAFKNAHMLTVVKVSHLLDTSFLNFGYTFGTGKDRWISHGRKMDQIRHLCEARILQAMVAKTIPYSVEGGWKIIEVISGAIETARLNKWCQGLSDSEPINIPIHKVMVKAKKSASEKAQIEAAVESGIWEGIEVKVKIQGVTEQIRLMNFSSELI